MIYILVKTYPNSPKLGALAIPNKEKDGYLVNNFLIQNSQIENFPEYWEVYNQLPDSFPQVFILWNQINKTDYNEKGFIEIRKSMKVVNSGAALIKLLIVAEVYNHLAGTENGGGFITFSRIQESYVFIEFKANKHIANPLYFKNSKLAMECLENFKDLLDDFFMV